MLCTASGVIYYVNGNHRMYITPSLRKIVCGLENFQRTFANLVVPPIDGPTKALVHCKGCPVHGGMEMEESLSKSIHKWQRYPFLNTYKKGEKCISEFGALLWRHRENCNMGAQLQSLLCITASKSFWKIYFLYDFWCTQTHLFLAIFGL